MTWESIGVIVSLVITAPSAAYHYGVVSTRIQGLKERMDDHYHSLEQEMKRARDRVDGFLDYWKKQ